MWMGLEKKEGKTMPNMYKLPKLVLDKEMEGENALWDSITFCNFKNFKKSMFGVESRKML